MSIPAVNITWLGTGPTVTGEVLAQASLGGDFARTLVGTFTQVLDGSLTVGNVNFIDGTASLPFTPSALVCYRTGGTGLSTIASAGAAITSAILFAHTFSAAGTNTQTVTFTVIVFK